MALTQVDQGLLNSYAQYTGFKNRIINGGMVIDQRYAGSTFSISAAQAGFCVDRFSSSCVGATVATLQQSSTAPVGFSKSLSLTVTTPDSSVASTDVVTLWQRVEGFNWADLGYGTADAQTSTLSFWVRASVTGNYGVRLSNSAYNRSYVAMYSISAANTWEYKTVTVPGDTTGTWVGDTNGTAIVVEFCLGTGSTYQTSTANAWQSGNFVATSAQTNLISTNGATFYITGVQLEKGSTATSFDYRPYGTELALCQRYFISYGGNSVYERLATTSSYSTSGSSVVLTFPVTMRSIPSISYSALSDWSDELPAVTAEVLTSLSSDPNGSSPKIIKFDIGHAVNGSFGGNKSSVIRASNTGNARMTFSAEL